MVHENTQGEIFNLGGNHETNEICIKDLAHMIKALTESDSPIEYVPKISLDLTLRRIIEYYES
jgi:nucleoside-diphosphate-sugar epimerase